MDGCCEICKRIDLKVHKNKRAGGKVICTACIASIYYRDKTTHEVCSKCGKVAHVSARNKDGTSVCPNCYNKEYEKRISRFEICSMCGKTAHVEARGKNGEAICQLCHAKSTHKKCSRCGEMGRITVKNEEGEICSRCYGKDYYKDTSKHEQCSVCGKIRAVASRDEEGKPSCHRCWEINYKKQKAGV